MTDLSQGISTPRAPSQRRAQLRFEAVLDAAAALLQEAGLAGFSIPALAHRLGFTRTSIYHLFPTPFAVLNELARRELLALETHLLDSTAAAPGLPWREQIRRTVDAAADFYDARPIAQRLILGSSPSDESYRAQAMTIAHLGSLSQHMFEVTGLHLPRQPVDVMVLAVELGTTCFRHSVQMHGRIAPAYREEAARVMVRYLLPYVREQAAARKSSVGAD